MKYLLKSKKIRPKDATSVPCKQLLCPNNKGCGVPLNQLASVL